MMNQNGKSTSPEVSQSSVSFAVLEEQHVAVIRVHGRGNFLNSVPLKKFTDLIQSKDASSQIILDLDECETMDSTFMGVLASISMSQVRQKKRKLILANTNEHSAKLLKTLGISNLVEVHECVNDKGPCDHIQQAEGHMETLPTEKISHIDQICHTLEAHRTLVRADGENEVRFQSVIHYLEKSLEEEES